MKISICVCTACHVNGAKDIVEKLQALIAENNLGDKVDLKASFCDGDCADGVFITVDEKKFSVTPEIVDLFFKDQVLAKITD